ncbi:MAG: 4-hydroxy-3-methylbut-2-enyl diphosphate reductase [Lachnospiraceae bacterium]|nr:4-hydroxy-3-methylbut-2-enyl diphosphate reductase [Lachnospiraceae bacterium]
MRVELAEKAGFCFGVSRAVDLVYREAEKDEGPVFTYGPIIHNEEVIADLEKKGVRIIHTAEEAASLSGGTIILRSHGVSKSEEEALAGAGLTVADATCPYVKRIHRIVHEYSEKGYLVLVIGSADHPEVEGIIGWTAPGRGKVIFSKEEAADLDLDGQDLICIVAQTTFHYKKFKDMVEIIRKKVYDSKSTVENDIKFEVHNTICSATKERQEAARELSAQVDAMIVIGGMSSSNTRKLCEICSEHCRNTYFIQTKEDLPDTDFSRFDYVGITAGASTPKNIIEEVQKYVRNEL